MVSIYPTVPKKLSLLQKTTINILKSRKKNSKQVYVCIMKMKKWQTTKEFFLYSLVVHVKHEIEKNGILVPIVGALLSSHNSEDIERFFLLKQTIKRPFSKRVVTD